MTTAYYNITWTGQQQREHVKQYVAALRSQEYLQGSKWLRQLVGARFCRWCIAGVGIDVAIKVEPTLGEWRVSEYDTDPVTVHVFHGSNGSRSVINMPDIILDFYGLRGSAVNEMINANDRTPAMTWETFAEFLEAEVVAYDSPTLACSTYVFRDKVATLNTSEAPDDMEELEAAAAIYDRLTGQPPTE